MEEHTSGDPMNFSKQINITLRAIADGIDNQLSISSISKILRNNDYYLRVSIKSKRTRSKYPQRGQQFDYINKMRKEYLSKGIPVIGIDGKKTELIGPYRQEGKTWVKKGQEYEVYDHEFPNLAEGKFIPFGIYDNGRNDGYVVVGRSRETTEFAVDALVIWWENEGSYIYNNCFEIYLTCDAGKPNSYRGNLFKYLLQSKFVDKFGISVIVSHYPPGDSKYHSIERCLFSFISKSLAGNPLYTYEKAIALIRNTKTKPGLSVKAVFQNKEYELGLSNKFRQADYDTININTADICPELNYTIIPRNKQDTELKLIKGEYVRITKEIWHFSKQPFNSELKGRNAVEEYLLQSNWKYHISHGIEVEIREKRKDGQKGRPPKNCEMYSEYFIKIQFKVSDCVD